METPPAHRVDEVEKTPELITEHKENENALTDSPIESVSPASEHVTAKTWIVIFVSIACYLQYTNLTSVEDPVINVRSQLLASSNDCCYAKHTCRQVWKSKFGILDEYAPLSLRGRCGPVLMIA
jgi:hypothetical protein